jgi:hypothetical protein
VHPKVVSGLLGHASVNVTLSLYAHVLPDMQREATAALDRLLDPSSSRGTMELLSKLILVANSSEVYR